MRISDWSSDVCSSDLGLDQWLKLHYMPVGAPGWGSAADTLELAAADFGLAELARAAGDTAGARQFRERSGWWRNLYNPKATRSEEHTSELQSLMRNSYAVFCLKKKKETNRTLA